MSQAEIGNLLVRLGLDTAQFGAGIKSAQGSLGALTSSLKGFAAGVAGALSLGALGLAIKSTIDHMDNLGKAAQKIGIPVEELSKLEYAGKLADVSLEDLTSTLAKFSKNIAEVGAGGENDAGKALTAIGVSATDANGKLIPTAQLILDIADKFSVMKDSANKTALAIALFGKSGAAMIPLLNGGSEAIKAAGIELDKFGGVVTKEAAAAAEEYNDNLTKLHTVFESLLQNALAPILPKLIELMQAMIDLAQTGSPVRQALEEVASFLDEWGPSLENTKREIESIRSALEALGLISKRPLEIDIPGADLAPKPEQTKDAPAIPPTVKKHKTAIPKDTLDDVYGIGMLDTTFNELWKEMESGIPSVDALTESFQNLADTVAGNLADALVGIASGTMSVKEAFTSMAQSISQQLEQLAAQLVKSSILKILSMIASSAAGGGGAGINVGGMTFGGLYADGGNLGAGKWGIAGEAGPEIIHGPARITPMDKMGGGSPMSVQINNYAGAEVQTRQGNDGQLQIDIVRKVVADELARGGGVIAQGLERGYGLRRAGR